MSIVLADRLLPADLDGVQPGRLATFRRDGTTYVVATIDPQLNEPYGLIVAEVAASGALLDADVVGDGAAPLSGISFQGGGLTTHVRGGETFVYVAGAIDGASIFGDPTVTVLRVGAGGALSVVQSFRWGGADLGGVPQNTPDPQVVSSGGSTLLIQPHAHGNQLTAFQIGSDGRLTERGSIDLPNGNADLAMTTASVGSKAFVIAADFYRTAPLTVFGVSAAGAFRKVSSSDPGEPLMYNRIHNDLATADVGGKTFVFSSENTSGSIAVHELSSSGRLTLVGYETHHTGSDSWRYPYALDAFQVGGETFLAAAGSAGAGLVVFAVSAAGGLVEVDEFVMPRSPEPRYVNDLDVVRTGGKTLILVSNEGEDSLQSYRFTPGGYEIARGSRSDTITGRSRDDLIRSGAGNDKVDGKAGDDLVEGGSGNDRLRGDLGDDDLYGEAGNDTLAGDEGNDWLFGGSGHDGISGGLGNDFIRGGSGNDRADGGDGNDRLFGDAGADRLKGGRGQDVLNDGSGSDTLTGGDGADRFVLVDDGARDSIADFQNGTDLIDLRAEGDTLIFPDIRVRKYGDGLLLTYGDDSLVLKAASGRLGVSDIGLDDFLLA